MTTNTLSDDKLLQKIENTINTFNQEEKVYTLYINRPDDEGDISSYSISNYQRQPCKIVSFYSNFYYLNYLLTNIFYSYANLKDYQKRIPETFKIYIWKKFFNDIQLLNIMLMFPFLFFHVLSKDKITQKTVILTDEEWDTKIESYKQLVIKSLKEPIIWRLPIVIPYQLQKIYFDFNEHYKFVNNYLLGGQNFAGSQEGFPLTIDKNFLENTFVTKPDKYEEEFIHNTTATKSVNNLAIKHFFEIVVPRYIGENPTNIFFLFSNIPPTKNEVFIQVNKKVHH